MTDSADRREREFAAFLEQVRWQREHPWWRRGAIRPEERERLVRIGLEIVLGDRADEVGVFRNADDTIEVAEDGHSFGFPIDTVTGDVTRSVFEHDVPWSIDELSEFDVAWAKRPPECPIHPDAQALAVTFTDSTITATCPVTAGAIRSASY